MVRRYLDRGESFSASDDINTPRTSATRSMSSVSNPRILTPSSTASASEGDRFWTPSSPGVVEDQDDHDPDRPLPSVERDFSSSTNRSTSTVTSPTASLNSPSTEPAGDDNSITQEITNMQNLRLTSPQTPQSLPHRASRTPSIHITPSVAPDGICRSTLRREDSLTAEVAALSIESHGLQESRSPSPSRRRRSGSGIRRERHQVESEDPPEAFAHMAEVQDALANARTLPKRLATVLSSSNLHRENGSSIRKLYQQAEKLNQFELPSSRIVGLVGDSGVGKSSLINSLLDKSDLARASSSGTACTCAVTEYHFHKRDDFVVHVDYFSIDELRKQYEELLRAHRDFNLLPKNQRSNDESDIAADDKQQLQKKSMLAIATFEASFGERLKKMPGILLSMPFERAVEKMVEWSLQLLPQAEQRSFSTIEECCAWSRELVSETESASSSGNVQRSWPFIQKVRVYLKAYILSKGLIIADLPGLRDLNSARQAITERYIRQCHQIFVVAKIDRAITDESIKQIFDLARRVELSKVDIVCTRSEEIQPREAIHDWPAQRVSIEELQTSIATAEKEMESLKEEIDDLEEDAGNLLHEDERQLLELQRDYRKTERAKETHDLELKRFIVTLRNDKVSRDLRQQYRNHPIATSLRIFCVSNSTYWDTREKPSDIALPYLQFSGIMDLRRYCIGVVAQSRLEATRKFIKDEIPALLGSIELWVDAGSGNANAESKQKVLDVVAGMQTELDKLTSPVASVNLVSRTLETEFNNQIYLRMRSNGPQWNVDARRASRMWEGWHHATYRSFCSNYGNHSTPAVGYRCWNEEAMQGMKGDLSDIWNSFASDLDDEIELVNTATSEVFNKVLRIAASTRVNESGVPRDTRSAMRTFASNLVHREHLTRYGVEKATETFESKLSSLRADALSSVRTAFIGQIMEATYHAANMEYGTGSDRRRKTLISGAFSSSNLFDKHRITCREKFRIVARDMQDALLEVVNEQVEQLEADLQILRDGNQITESERDVGFKKRVGVEVQIAKREVGRLGKVVGGE